MAKKKLLRKYSYLFRISISFFLIMGIMTFLISFTVISNSYSVMTRENMEYYQNVTQALKNHYTSQILTFRTHALVTSYRNLSAENNINRKQLESNPYYGYMAVHELGKYAAGLSSVDFMGIYFMGSDYVITSQYRFEMDDFLRTYSDGSAQGKASLKNMLLNEEEGTKIASATQSGNVRLYVGIPIASYWKEDVIVFYALKRDALEVSQFSSQSANPLYIYIYGQDNQLLYRSGQSNENIVQDEKFVHFLQSENTDLELRVDGVWYSVFRETNGRETFVTVLAQDEVEGNIRLFYTTIRNALAIIILVFFALIAVTVYINYRPILSLLENIKHRNPGDSEIDAVLYEFDVIKGTIHDQEIMIVDNILTNILCGMPVRESHMDELDRFFAGSERLFCLTVPELRLDLEAREGIRNFLHASFGIKAYIVERIAKNHIVIICAETVGRGEGDPSHGGGKGDVAQSLREHLNASFGREYNVFAGTGVADIRDIQYSYHNSLAPANTFRHTMDRDDILLIEGYPTENIELFLNNVQNGKTEDALKILDFISEFIQTDIKSVLFQRYVCYDLLTSYIKHCKSMGLVLENIEIEGLLVHSDINDLKETLAASVVRVCQELNEREKDIYTALQKDIIEYINSNYTNPQLTRTFVADHFKISVLSLSQIFNDAIGIGVREYVNVKRLELSRKLLLTTDKTILQVAREVGFTSADYFAKLFKATYNVLPSRFKSSLTDTISSK